MLLAHCRFSWSLISAEEGIRRKKGWEDSFPESPLPQRKLTLDLEAAEADTHSIAHFSRDCGYRSLDRPGARADYRALTTISKVSQVFLCLPVLSSQVPKSSSPKPCLSTPWAQEPCAAREHSSHGMQEAALSHPDAAAAPAQSSAGRRSVLWAAAAQAASTSSHCLAWPPVSHKFVGKGGTKHCRPHPLPYNYPVLHKQEYLSGYTVPCSQLWP